MRSSHSGTSRKLSGKLTMSVERVSNWVPSPGSHSTNLPTMENTRCLSSGAAPQLKGEQLCSKGKRLMGEHGGHIGDSMEVLHDI